MVFSFSKVVLQLFLLLEHLGFSSYVLECITGLFLNLVILNINQYFAFFLL